MKKNILIIVLLVLNVSCNIASVVTGTEETDLGENFQLDVRDRLLVFWKFEEAKNADKIDSENGIVLPDTSTGGFDKVSGPTSSAGSAVNCSSNSSGSGYFETGGFPYALNGGSSDLNISFWILPFVSGSATTSTILENPGNNITFTQLVGPDRLDTQVTVGSGSLTISGLVEESDFGTWIHLSFNIYAGGDIEVYKNGNYFNRYAFGATNSSNANFILCSGVSGSSPHNGYLDSFGIWERALNSSEIEALYKGNNNVD